MNKTKGNKMQQNADITYYLITQFIGLVFLIEDLFILFMQKVANKLAKQIETQTSELNALNKTTKIVKSFGFTINSEQLSQKTKK